MCRCGWDGGHSGEALAPCSPPWAPLQLLPSQVPGALGHAASRGPATRSQGDMMEKPEERLCLSPHGAVFPVVYLLLDSALEFVLSQLAFGSSNIISCVALGFPPSMVLFQPSRSALCQNQEKCSGSWDQGTPRRGPSPGSAATVLSPLVPWRVVGGAFSPFLVCLFRDRQTERRRSGCRTPA